MGDVVVQASPDPPVVERLPRLTALVAVAASHIRLGVITEPLTTRAVAPPVPRAAQCSPLKASQPRLVRVVLRPAVRWAEVPDLPRAPSDVAPPVLPMASPWAVFAVGVVRAPMEVTATRPPFRRLTLTALANTAAPSTDAAVVAPWPKVPSMP